MHFFNPTRVFGPLWSQPAAQHPLTPVVLVSWGRPLRMVGSSLQAKTWEPQSLLTKTHIFTHPVVLKISWVSKLLAVESLPALHALQMIPQHLLAVDKDGAYGSKLLLPFRPPWLHKTTQAAEQHHPTQKPPLHPHLPLLSSPLLFWAETPR